MSNRVLLTFSSLVESSPCFVIPVFSVPSENGVCVQDLDAFGQIARFVTFDASSLYAVPVLAPALRVDVGNEGVIAFWASENEVICDKPEAVKAFISTLNETQLPEFIALEAMTLLDDRSRLEGAARRASLLIHNDLGRVTLGKRVADRKFVLRQMQREQTDRERDKLRELDEVLSLLQTSLPSKAWVLNWTQARNELGSLERLRDIARWRLRTSGLEEHEGGVITSIFNHWVLDDKDVEFALEWLGRSTMNDPQWSNVWTYIDRLRHYDSRLPELACEYFYLLGDPESKIWLTWRDMNIWRRLWRRGGMRDRLLSLANSFVSVPHNRDHLGEVIMLTILDGTNDIPSWIHDYLLSWLSKPRSTNAWTKAYMSYSEAQQKRENRAAAMEWLDRLGRGSNQWIKLWEHVGPYTPRDTWISFAEQWLLTARTDLVSWPSVLKRLQAELGPIPTQPMIHAAERWIANHRNVSSDHWMKKLVDA